jgi:uncharacterized protein (TIGR04255 family)
VSTHIPWKNPPILEVIFEIRFQPIADYAIFVGGMAANNAIHNQFPIIEKLPGSDFPPFAPIEGVVRHKFLTSEKTDIFQTGQDVISVNSLNYLGFENFLNQIRLVINTANEFIDFAKFTKRIALRYINKFENHNDHNDIFSALTIRNPFDDFDSIKTTEIFLRRVKEEENLFLTTNIQYPVVIDDIQNNLVLDIEAFSISSSLSELEILDWCNNSHEIISRSFQNFVSDKERSLRE